MPHLPFRYFPIEGGYYHVPGEVWEFNNTDSLEWKVCSLTDGEVRTDAQHVHTLDHGRIRAHTHTHTLCTLYIVDRLQDPSCADSVPVYKWWPPDHLNYFGVQQNNCDH